MKRKNSFSIIVAGLLCAGLLSTASAQKLPDNQLAGIRAPQAVKVDGKATEWGTLQAFNKNTEVAYTMANDDSTLYLVVQSNLASITSKIMSGGITFTVNTEGKKKEKEGIAVTFPFIPPPAPASGGVRGGTPLTVVGAGSSSAPRLDPVAAKKRRDSLTYVNNLKRIDKFKDVRVTGIAAIKDTLLSIYNEEGIKTRCTYEESGIYTYELAIPLKYLALDVKRPKEFLFNLKLNGLNLGIVGGGNVVIGGAGGGDFQSMLTPTDFWGKYLMVK